LWCQIDPIRSNEIRKVMNKKDDNKEKTLSSARKLLYYNNLLIDQCDKWLSVEEGNKNMEKRILERKKKQAK